MDELAVQRIRLERDACVRKANDLIQKSRFDLSTQQQKIILYLISKITPFDDDFEEYQFTIKDFCRVCGITLSGTNYKQLKEQIKEIADKSIWVYLKPGVSSLLRWITEPEIDENTGIIKICLDKKMKPFLLKLKSNYTQYELIYTLKFRSKYSIRLYELVKSIHFNESQPYTKRYSLDEIRLLLGAETYTNYLHLRQRVIEPAIDEINEYSDKSVSWKPIKNGRAIAYIEFTIDTKDDMKKSFVRQLVEDELDLNQLSLFDIDTNDMKKSIEDTRKTIEILGGK